VRKCSEAFYLKQETNSVPMQLVVSCWGEVLGEACRELHSRHARVFPISSPTHQRETQAAKQTCIACRTFRLAVPYSVRADMFGQVLHMRACARARLLAVAFSRGSLCLRSRPTQGPSPTMVLVARLHALASACERFRACALTRACERSLARAYARCATRCRFHQTAFRRQLLW
jgi:hypothetical protein